MNSKTLFILLIFGMFGRGESTFAQSVVPESGEEGAEIMVSDFETLRGDPAIVILGTEGEGVVVDKITEGVLGLSGEVGPSGSRFDGQVEVWWGKRFELPAMLVEGTGVAYLTRSATWFAASRRSPSSAPFSLVNSSEGTTSGFHSPARRIGLPTDPCILLEDGFEQSVRVDIMMTGGNDNGSSGDSPRPGGGYFSLYVDLVSKLSADSVVTGDQLANDLAHVLNTNFGALGLFAESDADLLLISFPGASEVSAFASLKGCWTEP